jgi:hypothetical protein
MRFYGPGWAQGPRERRDPCEISGLDADLRVAAAR